MNHANDTIAAVATPPGRGGISIIRVSGSLSKHIAKSIAGTVPKPRFAHYTYFHNALDQPIDEGILLYFEGPHSFTGEDVLEFHGHGGPVLVNLLLKHILSLGARHARAGEFSERAFLNNKMDLIQAEAVADLIDASSEQAAQSALRSLQGLFSEQIHQVVEKLIHLRLHIEAAIDFAEEEIDLLPDNEVNSKLINLMDHIQLIKQSAKQGHLLRDGITAVITGKPNVGKSSLLNQLSGKDVAIVTDIAGTTRDILRDSIVLDGLPIHLIDTAGLRETDDVIEQEGIRRAKIEMASANLILFLIDATCDNANSIETMVPTFLNRHATCIIIRNKIDLIHEKPQVEKKDNTIIISVSAKTGEGLELVTQHIKQSAGYQTTEGIFSARQRHLHALDRAEQSLLAGKEQFIHHQARELLADDLNQAMKALNEITGEFTSDDLLGKIFSTFCIGK